MTTKKTNAKATKATKTAKATKRPWRERAAIINADHDAKFEATQKAKGKMSGLDAAAKILADAEMPLNAKMIVERMLAKGLWSTGGKTPAATIYAAMIREIAAKGEKARFKKTDRGLFIARA